MSDTGHDQLNSAKARLLTSALTANSEKLFQLIQESDAEILKAILHNPNICDDHLIALLKRRDLPEYLAKLIHQRKSNNLSHKLTLALVKNPSTSGSLVRSLLPFLYLFELVDLCFVPGVSHDQRLAAERELIKRLPTTPLGNKITLARRATTTVVGEILKAGDPLTLDPCLNNPRLKEAAVFQFLNGPTASAATISAVARHSRWKQRANLRLAILKNQQTPPIWFTLWLPKLPLATINQLLGSHRLSNQQKRLIQDHLKCRGRQSE